jgi:hypothetical protein
MLAKVSSLEENHPFAKMRRHELPTFTELELVENSRLSCCVETDHENSHFFLPELPKARLERKEMGWLAN